MKQSLSLLSSHLRVCISENESNGREEVTLSRSVAADHDIVSRRKLLYIRLCPVALLEISNLLPKRDWVSCLKALDGDGFDVHLRVSFVREAV